MNAREARDKGQSGREDESPNARALVDIVARAAVFGVQVLACAELLNQNRKFSPGKSSEHTNKH